MPLANIQFGDAGLDKWMFDHWQDHLEIIAGVKKVFNKTLAMYPIYPFSMRSTNSWVGWHWQMHLDMNAAIGTTGTDLSSVNFNDANDVEAFIETNFLEHSDARQSLGI